MLRDQAPGTFVVRDSNSFPGAFGLALKVAIPPPNLQNKTNDPASELVRHFLIEPTSRGVKLKGCSNEPVFSMYRGMLHCDVCRLFVVSLNIRRKVHTCLTGIQTPMKLNVHKNHTGFSH